MNALVVICAMGTRARQGAEILASHDVASAVLEGGMGAWASTYDLVEGEFGGATVVQIRRRGKGCLSYVIGAGTNCVVIDPSLELGAVPFGRRPSTTGPSPTFSIPTCTPIT